MDVNWDFESSINAYFFPEKFPHFDNFPIQNIFQAWNIFLFVVAFYLTCPIFQRFNVQFNFLQKI